MKVGLEIEYVVTVKQKKERKVEVFGYPKSIKKRNTKRLTSNRTEGGIAKNVHANIKFWTVYSTLIRDCALWQHFKLAAVHPKSNLFHLQKVSVRFQLSNVSP